MRKSNWKLRKKPRASVTIEAIGKQAKKGPQIRIWVGVSEETFTALERAKALRESIAVLDQSVEGLISDCRAEGFSWRQIGEVLGISRQAAWERFSEVSE